MYDIVKIQWKIVHIRCTESPNSYKNSNSLNVQCREKSTGNWVHYMYRKFGFEEKFEFVECTKSSKFNEKLSTLDGKQFN